MRSQYICGLQPAFWLVPHCVCVNCAVLQRALTGSAKPYFLPLKPTLSRFLLPALTGTNGVHWLARDILIDHTEHGQPNVRHALWGLSAISNAQHVAHGLKECEGVELAPWVILRTKDKDKLWSQSRLGLRGLEYQDLNVVFSITFHVRGLFKWCIVFCFWWNDDITKAKSREELCAMDFMWTWH